MVAKAVGVLSGTSWSSGWEPEKAEVVAIASGMHTLLWRPGTGACVVEGAVCRHICSDESQCR